ncbi:MAG: hypothetical protein ACI8UZ_003135, partial [Akkermansiaceae bacterium]
ADSPTALPSSFLAAVFLGHQVSYLSAVVEDESRAVVERNLFSLPGGASSFAMASSYARLWRTRRLRRTSWLKHSGSAPVGSLSCLSLEFPTSALRSIWLQVPQRPNFACHFSEGSVRFPRPVFPLRTKLISARLKNPIDKTLRSNHRANSASAFSRSIPLRTTTRCFVSTFPRSSPCSQN